MYLSAILKPFGIFCCFLLLIRLANAQVPVFNYSNYSVTEGLPQAHIFDIWQDSTGYIWTCTKGGLARFDGTRFKTYGYNAHDSTSLNSSYTIAIAPVKQDIFYVITDLGLNLYDPINDRFKRIRFPAKYFPEFGVGKAPSFVDYEGKVWIRALNGTFCYSPADGTFSKLSGSSFAGPFKKENYGYLNESRDMYWAWEASHLDEVAGYNIRTDQWKVYKLNHPTFPGGVRSFYQPAGSPFLFMIFRQLKGNFTSLGVLNTEDSSFVEIYNDLQSTKRPSFFIDAIEWNPQNQHLGFFSLEGYVEVDPESQQVVRKVESLGHDIRLVDAVEVSADGVVWFGASGYGLYSINTLFSGGFKEFVFGKRAQLGTASLRGILEDLEGNIWVGGYSGLAKWDKKTQKAYHILKNSPGTAGTLTTRWPVHSMALDPSQPEKYLWMTVGCCELNRVDLQELSVALNEINESFLPYTRENSLYDLKADTLQDLLWIAADQGIYKFDPKTFEYQLFTIGKGDQKLRVNCLLMSPDQKGMWLGTESGVYFFHFESHTAELRYGPEITGESQILSLLLYQNELWVSSLGNGILRIRLSDQSFSSYTTEEGLPNNVVYGVLPGNDNLFWGSTNKGIFRLDQATGEVTVFQEQDGLQNNEFNSRSYFKDSNGNLYFGGIRGLNRFNPSEIGKNEFVPKVIIQEVVSLSKDQRYHFNPYTVPELSLPEKDVFLKVTFAVISYDAPERNQFAYRIKGFNDSWAKLGDQNSVTLAGLPAGEYQLEVKASNNVGVWSEQPARFILTVEPPFYKELWFLVGLMLLSITGVLLLLRYRAWLNQYRQEALKKVIEERTGQLRMQNLELDLQKEKLNEAYINLKELQLSKDFFIGTIIHDLKIPLNTISEEATNPSVKIASYRMMNLVSNILDVQKLEDASVPVTLSSVVLEKVVSKAAKGVEQLAMKKSIKVAYHSTRDYLVKADPDLLQRVLENILNNAIKYSPSGEVVKVVAERKGRYLAISIIDNGPGIKAEDQPFVFMKYAQINRRNFGKSRSTGLGLVFSKLAVEAMKGAIELHSKEGKGATFTISILFDKELEKVENTVPSSSKIKADTFLFSAQETVALKGISKELAGLEIFQFSKVSDLLDQLPTENRPQLASWKTELISAMKNFNEKAFSELKGIISDLK